MASYWRPSCLLPPALLLLPHSKRELLAGLRESEQGTGAEVLVWGSVEELGETSSILLTVVLSSQ